MTQNEAVEHLAACKELATRLVETRRAGDAPLTYKLSKEDFRLIENFGRVQLDPVITGPGVYQKLLNSAGLTQVEISKLEQVWRMVERGAPRR